jgi:hypothetical protein
MWIFGGTDGSTTKNDVYSSTDGATWTHVTQTSPFPARDSQTAVVFPAEPDPNAKMWVLGGYTSIGDMNDAWYSSDGAFWEQSTNTNTFWGRDAFNTLVYSNAMWVFAGEPLGGSDYNDTWHSP